jgi:hypothetical protein
MRLIGHILLIVGIVMVLVAQDPISNLRAMMVILCSNILLLKSEIDVLFSLLHDKEVKEDEEAKKGEDSEDN